MNVRCWLYGHERYPGAVLHDTHWHQHERCARCHRLVPWGLGPWLGKLHRRRSA